MPIQRADIQGINDLLLHSYSAGKTWSRNTSSTARKQFELLRPKYQEFTNKNELSGFLPSTNRMSGSFENRFIYLAPPRKHERSSVFFLSYFWDFSEATEKATFYLHMFKDSSQKQVDRIFSGYRFETPSMGNHKYWHAQPIRKSGWDKEVGIEEAPPGHFDDIPAFPVSATDMVELFGCLTLSIYGLIEYKSVWINLSNNSTNQKMKKIISCEKS